MLLSQKLAGFTKGEADVLRKAMGKKIFALLETLKPKFLDGCEANGHDRKIAEKIWKDWEAFASYSFNKSHSTCYAQIAFQTAYLKANYPAAYMASVLSNNMNDIKQVTFFMEECRRLGTPVLGPSVNESNLKFTVNDKDEIRFGLGAIKGVGENAVKSIVLEREKNGPYADVYDFVKRVDLRQTNKRVMESLVLAGAFDCFNGLHRAQYSAAMPSGGTFVEHLIKFGGAMQSANDAPPDLFGDTIAVEVQTPEAPVVESWGNLMQLTKEKEVVGIYISAHPLDDFALEIKHFAKADLRALADLTLVANSELTFAGMVSSVEHRTTKTGKPFASFELEDFYDVHKFFLFSEDYLKLKHFLLPGAFLFVKGKVAPRQWSKTNELEFKITHMELLSDLREKRTKKVCIEMRLDSLDEALFASLNQLIFKDKKQKGCSVEFRVVDPLRKLSVKMPSRSMRIDLSNETISQLDGISGVKYVLIG
jgi:DNA polymerase-3 subunit alpha